MIKRTLEEKITNVSKYFPIILITGPRQVGKTTLLENISQKREYITLDDLNQRELAKKDPALFLQIHKPPLFIDEIQYAPELFPYIKMYVDKNKQNGDFWLTGSQKFHLMKNVKESLAGRVAIVDMLGISQSEMNMCENIPFLLNENWIEKKLRNKNQSITEIFEKIYRGSYPKLVADKEVPRNIFYSSYIQTYIERDVKDILKITNELKFSTFLKAAAARCGQLIDYTSIANDCDIDSKTAQSWVSVLESSGVVKLLYPYSNNLTNRAIKTPKLYFLDTGLVSYLTGWDSPLTLMNGIMAGNILETYVFCEIIKSYWNNLENPNIFFYRDTDKKEIDFIIEKNNTLYPIEVKKTAQPSNVKQSVFKVIEKYGKEIGYKCILCLHDSILPLSNDLYSIPISFI